MLLETEELKLVYLPKILYICSYVASLSSIIIFVVTVSWDSLAIIENWSLLLLHCWKSLVSEESKNRAEGRHVGSSELKLQFASLNSSLQLASL